MKKILLLAFLLISCSAYAESENIKFINGWIKQLPPVVPMRAGYLQIKNSSAVNQQIIGLQSETFESVEMHETTMADGMMQMVELENLEIPANAQIELKPGGKHMMLISPKQSLQIGDKVEVLATFSDNTTQIMQLEVRK